MLNHEHEALSALDRYVNDYVGGRFDVKTETVSIGTTVTQAVPNDFERLAITFINAGANDVHILPNQNVTISRGIVLGANGGFLSLTVRDDLVLVGYDWYGIATTAASDLEVISVLRYAR